MNEIPHNLLDEYVTEGNKIGNGTYCDVYKGKYRNTKVAIKKIKLELSVEAMELLTDHDCDYIISYVGISYEDLKIPKYIVLEYMEGGTLHSLIYNPDEKYTLDDICKWYWQISKALHFLHTASRHIIHRDIKPMNMLFNNRSRKILKLGDLESARICKTRMTKNRGTFVYMAPEVVSGDLYGKEADIYSLSISLAETISREPPYKNFRKQHNTDLKLQLHINKKKQDDGLVLRPEINTTKMHCTNDVIDKIREGWHENQRQRPDAKEFVNFFGNKVKKVNC